MDSFLLGQAVQKNGPDLIRHLQQEHQQFPENVTYYLSNYKVKNSADQDPELQEKICRFISKKADYLFQTPPDHEEKPKLINENEDLFAKMPPLETFMGIQDTECSKHFFNSVEKHDIVIGVVNSVMDSGLVITLLCLDNNKSRDIDELRISAFCPVKELPKLFPNQDAIEGFQVRDKVRAVVLSVNAETEKLIVSMVDRSLPEELSRIKLALINEDEFPVQFRRKLHIRGLTFDELLQSILGFNNSGNTGCLLNMLSQEEDCSFMRGLHRIKIPDKDLAENLRKYQSQKMAHSSVAQGITYFKAGKQSEAVQCFNKALEIDKTNVEALVARGALYANNESFNRAIDDFEDALKINHHHVNARKYLHDTLLAFGKSNEDIEKYQEAEELYTKAMSLDQASVEAREALRFLHYRKSQRHQKEIRRKSSPKIERRNSSDGFEETTKTLKRLIKGEDKRHRKKKRRKSSSESSSSSSRSSSSRSDDHRGRRDSKSIDRSQRNSSPPDDQHRQPKYEEEVMPHQQYGVDPQSSFLSGDGANFSEIFRASSQESETGQEQKISTHISAMPPSAMPPAQYGAEHYMYPQHGWYGMPGIDPTQMFGYPHPYPGMEQGYPIPPMPGFYPGNQMMYVDNMKSRRHSRSPSKKRSVSSNRRSVSSNRRSVSSDGRRLRRVSRSPNRERRTTSRDSRSRSRDRRRKSGSLDRETRHPSRRGRNTSKGEKQNSSPKRSPSERGRKSKRSDRNEQDNIPREGNRDRSSWSVSPERKNAGDIKNERSSIESKKEILPNRMVIEKEKEEKSEVYVEEGQSNKSAKNGGDISSNGQPVKVKSQKKKKTDDKKEIKKKKKEGNNGKKKEKKRNTAQSDNQKIEIEIKSDVLNKEMKLGVLEQVSMVSSTSDRFKEQILKNPEQVEDIRRVVPKDETNIQEGREKKAKGRGSDILDELSKSKWDNSPDDYPGSPLVRHNLYTKPETGNYMTVDQSVMGRNKRSNSREFEGIRIHIKNDQFGKQSGSKDNIGVVQMFHVNEQPGNLVNEIRNLQKKEKSIPPRPSKSFANQGKFGGNSIRNFKKQQPLGNRPKILPHPNKARTYRKKTGSKSRSCSSSRSRQKRSRSRHKRSRSRPRRSGSRHRRSHSKHRRSRSRQRRSGSRSRQKRSRSRSRQKRSRSRSRQKRSRSPPRNNLGVGKFKTRPMIKGRNKFTDSRSRSISPGRKYSGKLRSRSRSPHKVSYRPNFDRGRGSYRGNRGRNYSSKGYQKSHRSGSRGKSPARTQNRRSRSKSQGHDRGQGQADNKSMSDQTKSSDQSKAKVPTVNVEKSDETKLVELEDFYNQLKEKKKQQNDSQTTKN